MTKKLFMVPLLLALVLSACSGRGAVETATPAVTDTQPPTALIATTAAPAMTETFTAQPNGTAVTGTAATPTLGTVGPTNPADCTNSASFVADITIPDNSNIAPAAIFTKTWRIANKGTCVWGPDYKLTYYSEERMSAPDAIPVPITYPGENADISVNLTAPNSTGKHQANFVIKNSGGLIMKIGDDSRLWVVINVTIGGAAPTTGATATATGGTIATLPVATLPVATLPLATVPAATTSGSAATGASCLFTIDRTKLTEVINALNAYRAQKGLPAYTVQPQLARAAQKHSSDMACNHLSAHTGSDGSTPQARLTAAGYLASSVAEDVHGSNPPLSGQAVVNFWAADTTDATNNQNLLSATFTEIGVGYSFFDNSGYYVIVFAKP